MGCFFTSNLCGFPSYVKKRVLNYLLFDSCARTFYSQLFIVARPFLIPVVAH